MLTCPATGFYVNPEHGRHQARITYCLCIEDLKAAMKCLEEALKVYPGRLPVRKSAAKKAATAATAPKAAPAKKAPAKKKAAKKA